MIKKKINDDTKNIENTENTENTKKIQKIKKNINIFKKDKTIKIKLNSKESVKKSMIDALEANEVMLWGLNKIDSMTLENYKNKKQNKTNKTNKENKEDKTNKEDKENKENEKIKILKKTIDTEYIPSNTYNICDLDFLNLEYDRIENKISKMTDLNDEYERLLDLQDSLTELINELVVQSKENGQEVKEDKDIQHLIPDIIDETNKTKETNETNNEEILIEVEINKTKKKSSKSKKLKPYYMINEVPEGYREATEEEAIINKKVSFYGKKRVNRELNSLFEITGTIYMPNVNLTELNKQIIGLKGKLKYYKKDVEFWKISLESDTNTPEKINEIKKKINEIKNYYKKTLDIYNLYVKKYNEMNESNNGKK